MSELSGSGRIVKQIVKSKCSPILFSLTSMEIRSMNDVKENVDKCIAQRIRLRLHKALCDRRCSLSPSSQLIYTDTNANEYECMYENTCQTFPWHWNSSYHSWHFRVNLRDDSTAAVCSVCFSLYPSE